ncbi:MAG TPA: MarR family winged helix-turn-helix transcriptional regulator [Dyella sp.]|uniref:MarR family winged helix-turn-helix transcriptional regulator n=1 Tax=Dyella sp. TaxID=1869338 RepID=UPI002B5B8A0D|nr:MarR family winged helix-turn-helix transcriptional regulator [Dyella sp.]HTV83874.1 MarR family winged helix-turn-helix transcriptional regulator [Dyella sp.]
MSKYRSIDAREGSSRPAPARRESPGVATQADTDALYKMAQVCRVLKSAASTMEKLAHAASGSDELTLMHCLVLVHLSHSASCKQGDLKGATGIAPTQLTKLLDELAHRGLVSRHRSSWDRRQVILALTEQGRDTALRLLASLHGFTDKTRLDAIESLGSSLQRFVASTADDEAFEAKRDEQ